jgi:hypothetical protein
MNTIIAREFLARCFIPGETIAVLLRKEKPVAVTQRIVRLEQALSLRYLAWLRYENQNGANVYVAANPLRVGSRKRTKDRIAEVRHLYIDIDVNGEERIAALRASDAVPVPTVILSTSPNKYQVLWKVEGFNFDHQEETLKLLTIAFGGDPACTDRNRVLRVPGFHNRKYDPAHTVAVEYLSDASYHPDDFRLIGPAVVSVPTPRDVTRNYPSYKNTPSERDWAWVLQQLSVGEDCDKITLALASRRPDKPNALYYARRTVDIASARICLLEGQGIEDVIAMVKRRRSLEIAPGLCSSRAREIATTAQRMISRNKFNSLHTPKENHNATA